MPRPRTCSPSFASNRGRRPLPFGPRAAVRVARFETDEGRIRFVAEDAASSGELRMLMFVAEHDVLLESIEDVERIEFVGNAHRDRAAVHMINVFVADPETSVEHAIRALNHASVHAMGESADASQTDVDAVREYFAEDRDAYLS